jgi:hypothetical protein
MKYTKLITLAIFGALLVSLAGCNEVLENTEPATSVSGEAALSSPDGVNAIRASMYSKIREGFSFTTEYFIAPSVFADESRNRPGSTRYQGLAEARGTFGRTHIGNWGDVYDLIQDANLIIGAVDEGVLEPEVLNQYRGEALALRAFALKLAVRVYAYEPGNFGNGPEGNWDAGVVIVNEPVLDVTDAISRPRATVDEVYQQILADLNEAKGLLAGNNSNNTYVTEAFVDGLLARAHLFAGNWSEAASAAQNAINNFPGTLQNTPETVANMFFENQGNHPEALFKIVVNPDTENSTGGGSWANNGPGTYSSDGFLAQLPTQFTLDKYGEGDYRNGWYQPCAELQVNTGLTQPTNCDGVNENGLSSAKFNGTKGQSVDDLPYMRVAEMYIIWAEAAAKAANDPSAGVAPLQTLRDARNAGPVPAEALTSITAFEDFILDERIRELALEGHRFFDLKRLNRDVRNPDGSLKMRRDSYRILAPIGEGLINVNELLVENPGY